jgi:hypothetical protein
MKTSTKILCPNDSKRHEVVLNEDGTVTCACSNGVERGQAYAGRLMLGMSPIDGARGCAVLVALVEAASSLLAITEGQLVPDYGPWSESVHAYGKNPVYREALARAAKAHPERTEVKQLLLGLVERAGYHHSLGKRHFREEFRAIWDVPTSNDGLNRFAVSCFDDDSWAVPYMPGWKEQIFDKGLALLDGKVVVGQSATDSTLLYAIVPTDDGAHHVREHKLLRGKRLSLCA